MSKNEITIYVLNEKGEKVPQKLLLDENNVVVGTDSSVEESTKTPEQLLEEAKKLSQKKSSEVSDFLTANGVEFDTSGDGKAARKIKSAPPEFLEVFKFFSEHTPCWFEGCEELREQYNKELEDLGDDCKECDKGALIRKYHAKVRSIVYAK